MSNMPQPPSPDDSGGYGGNPPPGRMPQYPAAPQVPSASQPQRPPVPQPSSVRLAVRLMWAGAAIGLIGLIIGLVTMGSKSQIRDQLESSGQNVTENLVTISYVAGIGFVIVGGVLGVLLWLWMAWKNGQGRAWARVVATVFAAVNLVSTGYSVTVGGAAGGMGNGNVASWIVDVVGLAVGIVVVILLWRKESSEFFHANRPPAG